MKDASAPARIVLDTNVVLDWLVFRSPACQPLAAAIEAGKVRWIATAAMRDELAHVLARGHLAAWSPDEPRLWAHWERWTHAADSPTLTGSALRLRCRDTDDQKFIDLALVQARWLVSRDRAVLKLARRAAALGVNITPPDRWTLTPA
jgi:predicted nucleic acid-binding protein